MPRERPLEVVAQQHAVGQAGERIVQCVVDEPRFEPLAIRRVDEQALGHPTAAPRVVGHRERLVADPDLRAVPGEHPVLRAERLAGVPVRVVGGDGGLAVIGVDPARPELGVVDQLLGPVPEDAGDLRAHVGEAAAIRDVGVLHVDVDRGRDMLDEDLEARRRLVRLALRSLEAGSRDTRAPQEQRSAAEHDGQRGDGGDDEHASRAGIRRAEDRREPERGEAEGAAEQPDDMNAVGHAERSRGSVHARDATPARPRPLPPNRASTDRRRFVRRQGSARVRRAARSPLVRRAALRDNPRHTCDNQQPRPTRAMEAPRDRDSQPRQDVSAVHRRSWVDAASGETLDVENPATGEVVASVPASGQVDVDRAVDAATDAFETWSLTTPQTRSLALLKIADILDENADELGRLESSQTGKPTGAAIDEMAVSSDLFRFSPAPAA